MIKISVVIITLNEERNIRRCLESVQNIADEIIVVDSGSADQTEKICKEFGARFFQQEWLGYGAQKNYANNMASNDIILSLDADEALSESLIKSILAIKADYNFHSTGYSMNRLTNYCGHWIRHCGWYPDVKVRIFDRRQVHWNYNPVHEDLVIPDRKKIQHLNGDLLHYSINTIRQHIDIINRYSELSAKAAFEKGKKRTSVGIIFSAFWRFCRDYFLKGSFRDGFYGFVVCSLNSFSNYLRYLKLKQLYKEAKKNKDL